MSGTDEHPLPRGSRQVLMLSTAVMAAAATAVLVLGTQDARLLRLGLVAALWAALLGAFATVRARREISSCAEHADQLRTVYQLELEREVAARREHALTVERELRAQAEPSQRREIVELRTELGAVRASLEQLLAGNPLVERGTPRVVERGTPRAESAQVLPLPAHPRKLDDSRSRAATAAPARATVQATRSLTGPEPHFGPGRPAPNWGQAPSPAHGGIANGHDRPDAPSRTWSGPTGNNSPNNGGGAWWAPPEMPPAAVEAQRTVNDLLAAYGRGTAPRRRHSQENGSATSGEGVSRSS